MHVVHGFDGSLERRLVALIAGAGLVALALLVLLARGGPHGAVGAGASKAKAAEAYGQLPLRFEENRGQSDPQVKFLSRGAGYNLFLTPREAVLSLTARQAGAGGSRTEDRTAVLRMGLAGANPSPRLVAGTRLPGASNYLRGRDPRGWQTGVPGFSQVSYRAVYPGIDLVFHGNRRSLEYDFTVAPGGDPGKIELRFAGAHRLSLDRRGDLLLDTAAGRVRQKRPVVYQQRGAARTEVPGAYVVKGKGRVGFSLGAYDRARPLVIDPQVSYASYLGGSGTDVGQDIAVDSSGSAYVTGYTTSPKFPGTPDTPGTPAGTDAFVTKLKPDGSGLEYSTYLGGSSTDAGQGIAVASGAAYIAGYTSSTNFPGPSARPSGGGQDAFMAKLKPDGSGLDYTTYLGGSGTDTAQRIAIGPGGSAYVVGTTGSANFPKSANAQRGGGTSQDAFMAKLDPGLSGAASLVYSTYLGGATSIETGQAIAVDPASGIAYMTGSTQKASGASTAVYDFPSKNALQPTGAGGQEAFVAKLDPAAGSASDSLLYSTYFGGANEDVGTAIALDSAGQPYVVGNTDSDIPTTTGAVQRARPGGTSAFLLRLNVSGSAVEYFSYLGGDFNTFARGIAVDSASNVYVTGQTTVSCSTRCNPNAKPGVANFPTTQGAFQTTFGGGLSDAFAAKLDPGAAGSASLVYSSYLGGVVGEDGLGVAADPSGSNVYLTGATSSSGDFPLQNPRQGEPGGGTDAYVAKLIPAPGPPGSKPPVVAAVTPRGGTPAGGTRVKITGTRLTGATAVKFGDTPAQRFTVNSDTEMTAITPAHAAGGVLVTVTTPQGTSRSPISYQYGPWGQAGSLTDARLFGHTTTLLKNGKVLVTGGVDSNGKLLRSAELYDPKTNTWTPTDPMLTARLDHTATLLPNGEVVVVGGSDATFVRHTDPDRNSNQLSSIEIYNPDAAAGSRWRVAGKVTIGRNTHTATLLSGSPAECAENCGKVLVAGGDGFAYNYAEVYDPLFQTTVATGPLVDDRSGHAATLLSGDISKCGARCGQVLISGGDPDAFRSRTLATPELYDPKANAWVQTPPQAMRRFVSHTATLLSNGQVLVVGGRYSLGGSPYTNAELYNPVPGTWTVAPGAPRVPRAEHAAALLPSGKVLIAGGVGAAGTPLSAAEVYDPTGQSFTAVDPMLSARAKTFSYVNGNYYYDYFLSPAGPTATVLSADPSTYKDDAGVCGTNCGKVLIVGGSTDKSAELYSESIRPDEGELDAGSGPAGDPLPPGSDGPAPVASATAPATGAPQPSTGAPQKTGGGSSAALLAAEARRAGGWRSCVAAVASHKKREKGRANSGSRRQRARARRHMSRHAASARRACVKLYARTPGQITGLSARALSSTKIELSFTAPGTDGSRPPAARSYLVKQALRAISGSRGFARARSLCAGACSFSISEVGARVTLTITELRPHTTYYYALAARDNVSGQLGPRSQSVTVRTG